MASLVVLASNRKDEGIEKGLALPYLIQTEGGSSVAVLIDSKDRISGTPSNFRASFRTRIPRVRYLQLEKVVIPKIPNVNPNNNTMQIKHVLGTTASFDIPPGIYNTTTLSNEMTNAINDAFVAAGIADTVTVVYDPMTRTFSIASVNVLAFFIVNTCTFITRGKWLTPFESEPLANVPSKTTVYSGLSSMLYSRYLTIASNTINQYAFGTSATTTPIQPVNLIAIINLCEIYTDADFDVSVPFTAVFRTLPADGCRVSIMNSQRSMFDEVDILIQDEYGIVLENALDLGAPYPTSSIGMVLSFQCYF